MTVNFYLEFDFPGDNGTVFMNKKPQADNGSGMRLVNAYGTDPFDFDYVTRMYSCSKIVPALKLLDSKYPTRQGSASA